MKDHPMIFSGESVRGILADPVRKTMTRRVIKLPDWVKDEETSIYLLGISEGLAKWKDGRPVRRYTRPGGMPCDRIWVKETWIPDPPCDGTWPYTSWAGCSTSTLNDIPGRFRTSQHCVHKADHEDCEISWKSPMFMPRWASRITLEITGVKIERVQAISEEDAQAEGIIPYQMDNGSFIPRFEGVWDLLHEKHPERCWDANPWVVAITFKRVDE